MTIAPLGATAPNDTTLSAAPPAPPAPVAGAAPPPPALTPAVDPASHGAQPWLNDRIAQAKKSAADDLLKSLGVASADEAKAAIDAAHARADANKTAEQRAVELAAKLATEQATAAALKSTVAEHAARQMVGLTADQKAAVEQIAGSDPAAQLRAISALQPTWSNAVPPPVTASTPATPAAPPPAPNTAPGHNAPAGASASPTDHRATYEAARQANPFAAASYGLSHSDDVYKPRP